MGGEQAQPEITQLVLDHHREIYGYAYRLCGSIADAEDLTQAVFLTAHEKLEQLRDPESTRGWLYAILRSHFLKLCRKKRPSSAGSLELDIDQLAGPVADAADVDSERLQNALAVLPDAYRMALVMFYFEECTYQEIAEKLDIPMGTVMSRLARAKARLRVELCSAEQTESIRAHPTGKLG